MKTNPSFVRKIHEQDASLMLSTCARCGKAIGAATSHATLSKWENKHDCPKRNADDAKANPRLLPNPGKAR